MKAVLSRWSAKCRVNPSVALHRAVISMRRASHVIGSCCECRVLLGVCNDAKGARAACPSAMKAMPSHLGWQVVSAGSRDLSCVWDSAEGRSRRTSSASARRALFGASAITSRSPGGRRGDSRRNACESRSLAHGGVLDLLRHNTALQPTPLTRRG